MDPRLGRRRRAVLRDKSISKWRRLQRTLDKTARDASHRAQGLYARAAHRWDEPDEPRDDVLLARVRSKLGRYVSHAHAIGVFVEAGDVTLTGPILKDEVQGLMKAIRGIPGVKNVDAILEVRRHSGRTPALQGGEPQSGPVSSVNQEHWDLTTRAALATAGGLVATCGFANGSLPGAVLTFTGAALAARAITNLPAAKLFGTPGAAHAVPIHKSIVIHARVAEVFDFWRNYDNFPLFMHNVRGVRDLGHNRSHWTVAGPAGASVQFEASITDFVENHRISWKTDEHSTVASAGTVTFEPLDENTTRVMIEMSYNPPAGAVGHAVAKLFAADPKTEMDEDLVRLKTLIEKARFPHDAAQHLASTA
ncbi:MAG TPA: SRPBCC family protein [Tepidisphaeraceae bacterium]